MSVLAQLAGKAGQDKDNEEIGTPKAHYAPPSWGPFICMRCKHFEWLLGTVNGECDHPEVLEDAKAGYLQITKDGLPIVHHEGCCNEFNNKFIREES